MSKKIEQTIEESLGDSEAGKIWAEIKNRNIDMFALPSQKVKDHCNPINIEPSKLYLLTRSSAVLPSLEVSCGAGFVLELVDKYITVSRAKQSK